WQFNPKISMSVIPSWDGKGENLIDYVISMNELAEKSVSLSQGLATWAPSKWSGKAKDWWEALTPPAQEYFRQDWPKLLTGIRNFFMNSEWKAFRKKEFEDMVFRQRGYGSETPVQYIQRHKRYAIILYNYDENDSSTLINTILYNIHDSWKSALNIRTCPTVDQLIDRAMEQEESLIALWRNSSMVEKLYYQNDNSSKLKTESSSSSRFRRKGFASNGKVTAEVEDSEEDSVTSSASEDLAKEAQATDNEKRAKSAPSRPPWPKQPVFDRDDSVKSKTKPPGDCYICGSPLHFRRQCKMYGTWLGLKSQNKLRAMVSETHIDENDQLYFSLLEQSNDFMTVLIEDLQNEPTPQNQRAALALDSESSASTSKEAFLINSHKAASRAHFKRSVPANRNERRSQTLESKSKGRKESAPRIVSRKASRASSKV
ncbi:hypothetical protein K435DRAFT_590348, partial [Dendrothele bispora CBS 962.96]